MRAPSCALAAPSLSLLARYVCMRVCVTVCQLARHASCGAVPAGAGRPGAASARGEFAEVVPLAVVNEGFNVLVVTAHPQVDARRLAARCPREGLIVEVGTQPVHYPLEG